MEMQIVRKLVLDFKNIFFHQNKLICNCIFFFFSKMKNPNSLWHLQNVAFLKLLREVLGCSWNLGKPAGLYYLQEAAQLASAGLLVWFII